MTAIAWPDPPTPAPPTPPGYPAGTPGLADGRVFVQLAMARAPYTWGGSTSTWGDARWGVLTPDVIVDATCDVLGCSIVRGRTDPLEHYAPGRFAATLQDPDRIYGPASMDETGLRPMRVGVPIRVVAVDDDDAVVPLFAGTVQAAVEIDDGTEPPIVSLEAAGALGSLEADHITAPTGGAGELAADRMTRVLAASNYRADWWGSDLSPGVEPLLEFGHGDDPDPDRSDDTVSALELLQGVADSDGGSLYEAKDGTVVYAGHGDLEARGVRFRFTDDPDTPTPIYGLALPGGSTQSTATALIASMPVKGPTGDFTVRVRLSMPDWSPATNAYALGNAGGTPGTGIAMAISTTGAAQLSWYTTANVFQFATSTVTLAAAGVVPGETITLEAALDVDTGASTRSTSFRFSRDGGTSWTALGVPVTAGVTTGPGVTTNGYSIGRDLFGLNTGFAGVVYRLQVLDGIDPASWTVVADARFDRAHPGDRVIPDASHGFAWSLGTAANVEQTGETPTTYDDVCPVAITFRTEAESVVNAVAVRNREDGAPWLSAADGVSISWVGRRPVDVDRLLYTTTGHGQRLAEFLLGRAIRDEFQVTPLQGEALTLPGWWAVALHIELGDPVAVVRNDHAGTFAQVVAVTQGVRHDITRRAWAVEVVLGAAYLRTSFARWGRSSARWAKARWA